MIAYLSTVAAESQRHARFALTTATRINHAQVGPFYAPKVVPDIPHICKFRLGGLTSLRV
jgi:hypothetical protein